jgi:hypothetical protein
VYTARGKARDKHKMWTTCESLFFNLKKKDEDRFCRIIFHLFFLVWKCMDVNEHETIQHYAKTQIKVKEQWMTHIIVKEQWMTQIKVKE